MLANPKQLEVQHIWDNYDDMGDWESSQAIYRNIKLDQPIIAVLLKIYLVN